MNASDFATFDILPERDVLTVTFNRSGTRNSVTQALLEDLIRLAQRLRDANEIQFVVFRHEGPVFSAGADIKETTTLLEESPEAVERNVYRQQRLGQEMMTSLEGIDQITITELRGGAYGAGMAIVLTSDFRVMANEAVMNLPETRAGTFLTWGCTARLANAIGALRAKEMILRAENITAERCVALGLANEVVQDVDVHSWTDNLIEQLRERGPRAVSITKKLINAATIPAGSNVEFVEPFLATGLARSGEMLDGFASLMSS